MVNRPPNPIVRAVRNIIPLLPGSKYITPLADFVFRGFGLYKGTTNQVQATFYMTGMSALFSIAPKDTFAFPNYVYRKEGYDIVEGAYFSTTVNTVRMVNLQVEISNQGKLMGRQGRWSAAVIPYKTQETKTRVESWKDKQLSYKNITSLPYSVTGLTTTPIGIGYRFRKPDELCWRDLSMTDQYCAIAIAFEDLSREDYTKLTTDDFGCSIDVKTVMRIVNYESGRNANIIHIR
jgi:hypothetical protein